MAIWQFISILLYISAVVFPCHIKYRDVDDQQFFFVVSINQDRRPKKKQTKKWKEMYDGYITI